MKENKSLRIGTYGLLCYLIFRTAYFILTTLLIWLVLSFNISNKIVFYAAHIIICAIIPAIIFIGSIYKSLLKPTIPTFKNVCILFVITIIITFLDEGINIWFDSYKEEVLYSNSELLKTFYDYYRSSKIFLNLILSFIVLAIFIRKLIFVENNNLKKQSEFLKVGIASVATCLVFEKSYSIIIALLEWIYCILRIEKEFVIIILNILFGITSILFLNFLCKKFVHYRIPTKKNIYLLFTLGAFFIILKIVNLPLFVDYIVTIDSVTYNHKHLIQYKWSYTLNEIIRFSGIIYFITKLYFSNVVFNNLHISSNNQ